MPEKERNRLTENYSVIEQGDYVICCKISIQNGVTKKESFRINKNRLTGYALNYPEQIFSIINKLYDN